MRLGRLFDYVRTSWRLGPGNVLTVLLYRIALRCGLAEMLLKPGDSCCGPVFDCDSEQETGRISETNTSDAVEKAQDQLDGKIQFFSHLSCNVGAPPDWFLNPHNGKRFPGRQRHWSRLPDFCKDFGDIKIIWEASRFDWALIFARAYRETRNVKYVSVLNDWVVDWARKNPANVGPNWKCGQEVAIRMLQTLLAFHLLQQRRPSDALKRFVTEHCARIAPTIRYALAQDNNHGISEAAALFVGGAWLKSVTGSNTAVSRRADRWHRLGRRWLQERVAKLIGADGSFSQHSLNYHRVLLDTLNIVEFWRRKLGLPAFPDQYYDRIIAAADWLYQLTDEVTGDGPNIGANDGARLFVLSPTNYRDYRPTVQLSAALFAGGKAYDDGPWDQPLYWLGLESQLTDVRPFKKEARVFRDGGYVTLHTTTREGRRSWGVVRFPRFRFRPSHADALHFDLWYDGVNLLRDGGSYSYSLADRWHDYFSGVRSHNTVQFDERDQMPRLGRFLFGSWIRPTHIGDINLGNARQSWSGAYRDATGCWHKRTVESEDKMWRITDEIAGYDRKAVLRWRLPPQHAWVTTDEGCHCDLADLAVNTDMRVRRCELVSGWDSPFYLQKSEIPVLEIEVGPGGGSLVTEIRLA